MAVTDVAHVSITAAVRVVFYFIFYWNSGVFLSVGLSMIFWIVFVVQAMQVASLVVYIAEWIAMPPGISLSSPFSPSVLWASVFEVGLCAAYARGATDEWRGAIFTRLVLALWVRRLTVWQGVWDQLGITQRAGLGLASAALTGCCVLQWAYYATLPLTAGAEAADERTRFIWYLMLVSAVGLSMRSVMVLMIVLLRSVGYPLLLAVARAARLREADGLLGSVLDPTSHEFRLALRCVGALLMAGTGWSYAPEDMPLIFQILVLIRMLAALGAVTTFKRYRRVLLAYPDVRADPQERCGICLDDFRADETVKRMPCGHCFHGRCVRRWLTDHSECPICRQPVRGRGVAGGAPVAAVFLPNRQPAAPATGGSASRRRSHRHVPPAAVGEVQAAGPPAPALHRTQPTLMTGSGFTGSVQPLAPRLPLHPHHPTPRPEPPQGGERGAEGRSGAATAAGGPHYEERLLYLSNIDRQLAVASQQRQQQQRQLQERQQAQEQPQGQGQQEDPVASAGEADLFEDEPLLPPAAAPAPPHTGQRRRARDSDDASAVAPSPKRHRPQQ